MSFTYNASAIGLGGVITQGGVTTVIPSQASVALAPSGGRGTSEVENYNQHGVSFSYARTDVQGMAIGSMFMTKTNVLLADLSVFGRLKARIIEATVESIRDGNDDDPDATQFTFDAKFFGLQFDDEVIAPTLALEYLNGLPKYQPLAADLLQGDFPTLKEKYGWEGERSDLVRAANTSLPIRCSLIDGVHRGVPGARQANGVVDFAGFAKVHLAEVLAKPGRRRVSLLRLEFGPQDGPARESDADGGSMTIASAEGNGTPSWP